MSDVTLSKAVRSNLLHLQNTAKMMDTTQERLATGKKVNSALDNPTNFFTASSLNARAADIGTLLDAMSNGIRTIEAADHALTTITKTIESMQSTLRQARQDKTFQVQSYAMNLPQALDGDEELTFAGGALGSNQTVALTNNTPAVLTAGAPFQDIDLSAAPDNEFSFTINNDPITLVPGDGTAGVIDIDEAVTAIQARMDALNAGAGNGITVSKSEDGQSLVFTSNDTGPDAEITIDDIQATGAGVLANGADLGFQDDDSAEGTTTARTVDQMAQAINSNADLRIGVRASNDNGKLRIENLSTSQLDITGLTTTGITGDSDDSAEIGGNNIRANLARDFNGLRTEIDRIAEDSSYNGINLLRGDQLKIVFNELGTSMIEVEAKGTDGQPRPINSATLGIFDLDPSDLDLDGDIDDLLHNLQLALGEVRSQASQFGTTLSVVQNRENFTKKMINTLETGAANLTLADTNEEAANMLALQTRQQLSQTALSLASQNDQAVLRLFG